MKELTTFHLLRLAFVFCFCTQVSSQYLAGIFFPSGNNILFYNSVTQNITVWYQASTTDQVSALKFDSLGALSSGFPKLYFSVESTSTSSIYSCPFAGCNPGMTTIYTHTSALSIYGMELDPQTKSVFWIAGSDIWQGKPDGTLVQTIKTSLNYPRKLAISSQGIIYVTLASKNGKKAGDGIGRMNTSGGNYSTILSGGAVVNPSGICVDSNTSTLYIIDLDKDSVTTKKIVSSDVNGNGLTTEINTNLLSPQSIAFFSNSTTKEIYWVDITQQTLTKYNLVEGGRTTVASFSYTQVTDLALSLVYTLQTYISPSSTPSVTPSVTPSITPSSSTTPSTTSTPSITPSTTPSVTSSPWTTPSVTPSSSLTPSTTPSITPTASTTPSTSPSSTPPSSVTPSTSSTYSPSVTTTCEGISCDSFFSTDDNTTLVKKYNRSQLLAVILIPTLLSVIGSAVFISVCVVLMKRQQRRNYMQTGATIPTRT
mmetsp:Transcript_299/g.410  ORF Transcript_299/g.410 Transcript_299/m.410 type:complete len:483 (+) Transcript_299:140-1588(+)